MMGHFGSLRGHYSYETALGVKLNLRFEINDLKYLLIYEHMAYMVWAFLTA